MLSIFTPKGSYATAEKSVIRVFDNEEQYKAWKLETDKNGHSMSTFYKIKCLINCYSEVDIEELKTSTREL